MYYVYLIRSTVNSEKTYIGFTADLQERLQKHNSGGATYTAAYKPWKLVVSIAFDEEAKAASFERYLKKGSGHAFAKQRFW